MSSEQSAERIYKQYMRMVVAAVVRKNAASMDFVEAHRRGEHERAGRAAARVSDALNDMMNAQRRAHEALAGSR